MLEYLVRPSWLVAGALLLTAIPVFLNSNPVYKKRWFSWLVLFGLFGALTYQYFQFQLVWVLQLLLAVIVLGMVVEIARVTGLPVLWKVILALALVALSTIWFLSPNRFFALFVIVAAFDVGGWVGGNTLGRKMFTAKLAPAISPNKTWAGVVVSILLAGLTNYVTVNMEPYTFALFCILAIVGDLAESAVKRRAGIKDMGNTVPGFGGLLDRFDSMLFAGLVLFLVW